MTGNCTKGITLANVKNAEIREIKVTGFTAPLIGISSTVTGSGLDGAGKIDSPKLPDPVPAPATPYQLR